jgi:parallel beta-helix repeat protein
VALSGSCRVTGNIIKENAIGIGVAYSSGSSFYHNDLIDNTDQLAGTGSHYTSCTWNDGAGMGNHWSDYAGTDTDDDGVGDTDLPHQGVDYYPLMEAYN